MVASNVEDEGEREQPEKDSEVEGWTCSASVTVAVATPAWSTARCLWLKQTQDIHVPD